MGLKNIERNLKKIQDNIKKQSLNKIKEIADDFSKESLSECPLDTGVLRESYLLYINYDKYIQGSVNGPTVTGDSSNYNTDSFIFRASYNTKYALLQHEELSFNHPTPGTKAKYMEDPLKRNKDKYMNMIKDGIKEGLK